MNRIDRLLGILTLLQSKKFVPAEKIADKFDISVRTVYRDIKALGELGIPVSFEAARGYFPSVPKKPMPCCYPNHWSGVLPTALFKHIILPHSIK
jgi:biotin operon repressor